MNSFDQRAYQTFILAALLHDIGKFYQRACREKGDHQHLGDQCFEEYFAERLSKLLSFEEIDIIRNAINNHHGNAEYITLADGLSAGMDRLALEDYETGDSANERLQSIFQKVSLGAHIPTENYQYRLKPLSLSRVDIFPMNITADTMLTDEYSTLWDGFKNEMSRLQIHNLASCVNSIYHLLWKYTWCVPGAVYKSEPDISLFDH